MRPDAGGEFIDNRRSPQARSARLGRARQLKTAWRREGRPAQGAGHIQSIAIERGPERPALGLERPVREPARPVRARVPLVRGPEPRVQGRLAPALPAQQGRATAQRALPAAGCWCPYIAWRANR
jgi:hypothetical protein